MDGLTERSKYHGDEYIERLLIVKEQMRLVYISSGREVPDDETALDPICRADLLTLEMIPTRRLQAAFRSARASWHDQFLLSMQAVRKAYHDLIQRELAEQVTTVVDDLLHLRGGPGVLDMSYDTWLEQHNLPQGFRRTNWVPGEPPYPIESDLYREADAIEWLPPDPEPFPTGSPLERDPRWLLSDKLPWEMYPDPEHPKITEFKAKRGNSMQGTIVGTLRHIWFMERCVEMENPANVCPGYVVEHLGTEGRWRRKHLCPFHPNKWDGVS